MVSSNKNICIFIFFVIFCVVSVIVGDVIFIISSFVQLCEWPGLIL